jgi:hypothetical protein
MLQSKHRPNWPPQKLDPPLPDSVPWLAVSGQLGHKARCIVVLGDKGFKDHGAKYQHAVESGDVDSTLKVYTSTRGRMLAKRYFRIYFSFSSPAHYPRESIKIERIVS